MGGGGGGSHDDVYDALGGKKFENYTEFCINGNTVYNYKHWKGYPHFLAQESRLLQSKGDTWTRFQNFSPYV